MANKRGRVEVVKLKPSSGNRYANFGPLFERLMRWVTGRHLVALELVGETHTFPARTDRLIVHLPKTPRVESMTLAEARRRGLIAPDVRKSGRRR